MAIERAAKHILDHYLYLNASKPIVIVSDDAKRPLAQVLGADLERRGQHVRMCDLGRDPRPLPALFDRLLADSDSGLIVLSSPAMWRAGLSAYLQVTEQGPTLCGRCEPLFFDALLPLDSLVRLYGSDPLADRAYLQALDEHLAMDVLYRMTTPAGTYIRFQARHWLTQDWEILTSPIESTIEGRIIVDASVFFAPITAPLSLEIRHGRLSAVTCPDSSDSVYRRYVEMMAESVQANPSNGQLAEVGLGGNGAATISGIIMEDETVRDTCHFCFGDNSRYGGANTSDWHGGTVVVRHPRFEIDSSVSAASRHTTSC